MSSFPSSTDTSRVAGQRRATRPRIVLVDDEPRILEVWGVILAQSGYEVQSFADPVAAVEAIAQGCDCVITDYHLPHMTGVELIRAARERSQAKFILMTANCSAALAQEALSVGASAVVHKPTSPPLMLQHIASLCE